MSAKKRDKKISQSATSPQKQKSVAEKPYSTNNEKVLWRFDRLDKDDFFAFDILRDDFNHREVLEKIISYSNMTWNEIAKQTHDNGKSKHHMLAYEKLSSKAQSRIKAKRFEEFTDQIFSFALQNKLRIIGIREGAYFHAVWYDPEHKFCPSTK